MASKCETILAALHAQLQTLAAPVLRGEVLPERIPATGLIVLRDGKPGEPEVTLSPLTYFYEHRAELEVVIRAGTGRDTLFDALTASIGATLAADRTMPSSQRKNSVACGSVASMVRLVSLGMGDPAR